jgi:hypothetical protein
MALGRSGATTHRAPLAVAAAAATLGLWAARPAASSPTAPPEATVLSEDPTAHSVDPAIAVTEDGTVHVVWQQGEPGVDEPESIIMHRTRAPDGSWSETREVYWDGVQPAIATDGRTVAVAFVRNPFDRFDTTEILYKIWDRSTSSWPDIPRAIQGGLGLAGGQPDAAFDPNGYLWLAWISSRDIEQRPYYARVLAGTNEVDSGGPIDEREQGAQGPALAMDPERNVHVVWSTTYASGEADLSRWEWPSGGAYWINRESALYDQIREARSPDIAAGSSALCVTWHEGNLAQPNEVILSCDRASGSIWFGNVSRTPSSRSLLPSLSADEERGAMVLWFEREPAASVVFGQILPPGEPASAEVRSGTMGMPSLAYRDGFAHAVWVEQTAQGGSEVRFARWAVDPPEPTATPTPSATGSRTPTATRTVTTPTSATPRTPTSATPRTPTSPTPGTPTHGPSETTPGPRYRVFTPYCSRAARSLDR